MHASSLLVVNVNFQLKATESIVWAKRCMKVILCEKTGNRQHSQSKNTIPTQASSPLDEQKKMP